jgi:hypothetical protein
MQCDVYKNKIDVYKILMGQRKRKGTVGRRNYDSEESREKCLMGTEVAVIDCFYVIQFGTHHTLVQHNL